MASAWAQITPPSTRLRAPIYPPSAACWAGGGWLATSAPFVTENIRLQAIDATLAGLLENWDTQNVSSLAQISPTIENLLLV